MVYPMRGVIATTHSFCAPSLMTQPRLLYHAGGSFNKISVCSVLLLQREESDPKIIFLLKLLAYLPPRPITVPVVKSFYKHTDWRMYCYPIVVEKGGVSLNATTLQHFSYKQQHINRTTTASTASTTHHTTTATVDSMLVLKHSRFSREALEYCQLDV